MANNRVIAHYAHEAELLAAEGILGQPELQTESYAVFTQPDDATLKRLREAGLIVEILEEPDLEFRRTGTFAGMAATSASEGMPSGGVMAAGSLATAIPAEAGYFLITLSLPLFEALRVQIDKLGVVLLQYSPPASYSAYLTPSQVEALRALSEVSVVRPYVDQDTGSTFDALPMIVTAAAPSATSSYEVFPDRREDFAPVLEFLKARGVEHELHGRVIHMKVPAQSGIPDEVEKLDCAPAVSLTKPLFDLRLHREDDLDSTLKWLAGEGIKVVGNSKRKIRVSLDGDDGSLYERIRRQDAVADLDPYLPPYVDNDVSRELLGIDAITGGVLSTVIVQDGTGEVIGVADTGIDVSHPDLANRLLTAIPRGRPGNASDPHGHGTHVSGSIVGDGTQSGGRVRGVAPQAQLVVQSLLDSSGRLGGLPVDLNTLFDEAYQQNVRIHNNSWGSATASEYVVNSEEVDEFVWNHPDMLIVISAGNEGTAASPSNSAAGYVDLYSIGAPATAKNALTVGASRSARNNGGYSQLTYGQAWGAHFPTPPIKDERVSGDSNCIAGFSSRGPCTDNRIKPDLVAPGTDILSTRSSSAPGKRFWGLDASDPAHYGYMGGTSMAAPLVAGCAALVRQYYRGRGHSPSAALLKATLINSTRWLTGIDAVANHPGCPNYHQGWGLLSMQHAIPNPAINFQLDFIDGWQQPAEVFKTSGDRRRYVVTADHAGELRVCLSWTDPPARAIQNKLHLTVQNLQTAKKLTGNENRPKLLNSLDHDNNVQVVRIDNVQPGERYMIMVSNTSLLHRPQPFALVVTAPASSPMTAYHG